MTTATSPERGAGTTVFLHIGLHKTGTTYLQNVLRANREELAAQRVYFPGGSGGPVQAFAVWDLVGRRPRGARDTRIAGQWDALVRAVRDDRSPTTLVSEEYLSLASAKQARRAVEAFAGADVHVIVTARDLGRVLVSAWQEEVKNDRAWTWQEFADAVRDPSARGSNPARGFWLRQDLPTILATWRSVVPEERIHVVTVPPPGTAPTTLLERFAGVVGFDARRLTREPAWNNESVGVAGTEVVRRLNELLARRLNQRQYTRVVRRTLVPYLARRTDATRFALPAEDLDWVTELAKDIVRDLESGGYDVVGDLSELLPRPIPGSRRPDDASEAEVLETAMLALAGLTERQAKAWWAHRRPDRMVPATGAGTRVASAARGAVFRGRRAAADWADRSPVAGRAMGLYLRSRRGAGRRGR